LLDELDSRRGYFDGDRLLVQAGLGPLGELHDRRGIFGVEFAAERVFYDRVAVVVGVDSGGERDGAEAYFLGDSFRENGAGFVRSNFLALAVLVVETDEKRNFFSWRFSLFPLGFRFIPSPLHYII